MLFCLLMAINAFPKARTHTAASSTAIGGDHQLQRFAADAAPFAAEEAHGLVAQQLQGLLDAEAHGGPDRPATASLCPTAASRR